MAQVTYPDGYGTARITFAQMVRKYSPRMHPVFAILLFWYIYSKRGLIGFGGGERDTQPDRPGFAPDGKSFHQLQRFASGLLAWSAVDLVVGVPGSKHRSPTWAETADAPRYGLHTFITGEPWHIQAMNIRGWATWVRNGRPDPARFVGMPATVNGIEIGENRDPDPYRPDDGEFWVFPLDRNKPDVHPDNSWTVHGQYAQDVLAVKVGFDIVRDGKVGPETMGAVNGLLEFFDLDPVDYIGGDTWGLIDAMVVGFPEVPVVPIVPDPADVGNTAGLYYVRPGDAPWSAAEVIYGDGPAYVRLLASVPAVPGFGAAGHQIEIPDVHGVRGLVEPGDGPLAIIGRLRPDANPYALLDEFDGWNGTGEGGRVLQPGDTVFLPADAS